MSAALTNRIAGKPFIILNSVDSTNNYAMQMIKKAMAKHGTAYFAYEQTAGKGQRNKQWLSATGENIILSVVLEPEQLLVSKKFLLNVITALAVKNLFNNYTTDIKIKWPNDIYWCDRKAAGVLIENIIKGDKINHSVAGFGININQTIFDTGLKNPVSLKQVTGKNYNVIELAQELCLLLNDKYIELQKNNTTALMNEYNDHLYKKKSTVKFKKDAVIYDAHIIEVNEQGNLIIEHEKKEALEFGNAEWLIQ